MSVDQPAKEELLNSTKRWLQEVVVAMNFCPFAARPLLEEKIKFVCLLQEEAEQIIPTLEKECLELQESAHFETTLLITAGPGSFLEYLEIHQSAVEQLNNAGYQGIFQLASFHPEYQFADSGPDDPANYTNRSPFPIFHILREESVSKAVDSHPDVDGIPLRNMAWAREKGLEWMQTLLKNVSS